MQYNEDLSPSEKGSIGPRQTLLCHGSFVQHSIFIYQTVLGTRDPSGLMPGQSSAACIKNSRMDGEAQQPCSSPIIAMPRSLHSWAELSSRHAIMRPYNQNLPPYGGAGSS